MPPGLPGFVRRTLMKAGLLRLIRCPDCATALSLFERASTKRRDRFGNFAVPGMPFKFSNRGWFARDSPLGHTLRTHQGVFRKAVEAARTETIRAGNNLRKKPPGRAARFSAGIRARRSCVA